MQVEFYNHFVSTEIDVVGFSYRFCTFHGGLLCNADNETAEGGCNWLSRTLQDGRYGHDLHP